jgi:hypothetical protein
MVPDDWLQTIGLNTGDLSNDTDFHVLRRIFGYRQVARRMVLLVRHDHVGDEGTLRRQEADRQLNSFAVPELTVLPLKGDALYDFVLLMQKSELGA